jgi:hypothetical protein
MECTHRSRQDKEPARKAGLGGTAICRPTRHLSRAAPALLIGWAHRERRLAPKRNTTVFPKPGIESPMLGNPTEMNFGVACGMLARTPISAKIKRRRIKRMGPNTRTSKWDLNRSFESSAISADIIVLTGDDWQERTRTTRCFVFTGGHLPDRCFLLSWRVPAQHRFVALSRVISWVVSGRTKGDGKPRLTAVQPVPFRPDP